jgi:hypothetical protein
MPPYQTVIPEKIFWKNFSQALPGPKGEGHA